MLIWTHTYAQLQPVRLSLHVREARMEDVLSSIGHQTGYFFVYDRAILRGASRVTLSLDNAPVFEVLDRCFEGQPLTYVVFDKTIVVKLRVPAPRLTAPETLTLTGRVSNERKEAVPGASVRIKGTGRGVFASDDGGFTLARVHTTDTLVISCIGYEPREIPVKAGVIPDISLKMLVNTLDETVIIAYGTTTRRLNTGSVSKVTQSDIGLQPVADPMAALEGRVPGLLITQSSGIPGSYFKVQIRGQNSILQGSDPLFVVDGIPYAPNNTPLGQIVSAANPSGNAGSGGLSPLALLNPADIESIEILKDADATAIYGSRGAGGVVLITTRRGKPGKTGININVYTGAGEITHTMPLMKTSSYLQMRREAFVSDQVTPTSINAPDLLVWDTSRYTNFPKLLIGGIGATTDAGLTFNAGNDETQVLMSGNYHRQAGVFPGSEGDQRTGLYVSVIHHSLNKRFSADFMANLTADKNTSIAQDLTASINIAPDYPSLTGPGGKPEWQEKGVSYTVNPMAYLLDRYTANTGNMISHLQLRYKVLPGLTLKASLGYNTLQVSETGIVPIAAQNPSTAPTGFAQFGNKYLQNWIAEPQIEYTAKVLQGKLDMLAGATWQGLTTTEGLISAYGYQDDALLGSTNGASGLSATNFVSDYRYEAVFSRLNYNVQDRYILNLSAREDGSSRFGPGKQFARFEAAGAAWIFSKMRAVRDFFPFLSFGKLRASYGITGNDQIGDYQYLDIWSPTPYPYLGSSSLYPARLYNPYYSWEINRKIDVGLELGFLHDRILLTTAAYRDRDGNQLIKYGLPLQTGFTGITENFPALVQNKGFEFSLTSKNITGRKFSWSSTLNVTLPWNKLLSFPGIGTSSYSNLQVGQPLSIVGGYINTGVNPETGIFSFKDLNNDGQISYPTDYAKNIGHLAPDLFGGWGNNFTLHEWTLDVFAGFRVQKGPNYYYYYYNSGYLPGTLYNQPASESAHWQKTGQSAPLQRLTAGYNASAYLAGYNFANSSAAYSDASFIRISNISLSYSISADRLKKWGLQSGKIYLRAQNLLTLTHYKGSDPETQNAGVLPPLKVVVAGIQFQF